MRSSEMTKPALASGLCKNNCADGHTNQNLHGHRFDMNNSELPSKKAQPLDEVEMANFIGDLVEIFVNGVRDQAPGGFWLYGQLVGDKRRTLQGYPLPELAEGFHRWRLPGVDGIARKGDRKAPSLVYSEASGALLLVRRDNLKPKRLKDFAALVRALEEVHQ
ncbi:MAG: hypothetical protein AB7E55_06675 [Pigmentiphaga sp.]